MPAGPGLTASEQLLWAQRIQKESINAKARQGGFSVRAAVSVPDVPTKFKPGHMDPREASGSGFDPKVVGWDPAGTMTTDFRRCMNQQTAGPRERHLFPETAQQEIGWIQGRCGKPKERSEPAGSKPTRLGVGWLVKDGHGGMMARAAEKAGEGGVADVPDETEKPRVRKSKDGNVREALGVPPYATQIPCAVWPDESEKHSQGGSQRPSVPESSRSHKGSRSSKGSRHRKSRSKSELSRAGQSQLARGSSVPNLQPDPERIFLDQEKALSKAMTNSREYLNGPTNMWYKPLSNSDVATFADAYTKAWGVGLYSKPKHG
eukprot:gb/GFBE01064323.1/.p1 GENE.gb/GFBE01064323.1/~~gb/GFBE01064323.1/.p1  ORF type:complete len:319 (+),score=40.68 gb/GFBE01064323.1/:1-957(+)